MSLNFEHIISYFFWPKVCFLCFLKYLSGAVWSGSALYAYAILSDTLVYEILGHLLYIIMLMKKKKNLTLEFLYDTVHCNMILDITQIGYGSQLAIYVSSI